MPAFDQPEKRRKLTWIFWITVVVLGFLILLYWILIGRFKVYTDDSYVEGNLVAITPLRPGFVTAIHTDDTFLVNKGQLLVELDKTDSEIALEKAKQELGKAVREVSQAFHQVFAYQAELEIKKADLKKVTEDYQHRAGVLEDQGVSLEDYQHAVAALQEGYFSFKMTQTLYNKALAFVQGTTIRNHPTVVAAAQEVINQWVQLYRCAIYSPVRGLASQRRIQVGMWAQAGEPLLSVIPLDQIWVNANFKETQLKHMRIGQEAKITSDLYGSGVVFHGKIVGLPGGAGNAFSLLPPQNLSGNWIKIVQRLPVRVALDPQELIDHPLRVGLSMETTVDLTGEGELIPCSNEGSPTYCTSIFQYEEKGTEELIECLFCENLDPTLEEYSDKILDLKPVEIDWEIPTPISSIELCVKSAEELFSFIHSKTVR